MQVISSRLGLDGIYDIKAKNRSKLLHYLGVKVWNETPVEIRNVPGKSYF